MAKRKDSKPPLNIVALNSECRDLYEAINHESPLPCVLISVSYIEKCLAALLAKIFIEGDTSNKMLHHTGMIGELNSRAKLAYCLGIIDKAIFNNLTRIGEIRNVFAHSHLSLTFDDPEIALLCKALTFPLSGIVSNPSGPHSFSISGRTEDERPLGFWDQMANMRERFTIIAILTANTLEGFALRQERLLTMPTTWTIPDRLRGLKTV